MAGYELHCTRYELHCKKCNQLLGYMTFPGSTKDTEIINATQIYNEYHELLCPVCEVQKLLENKNAE